MKGKVKALGSIFLFLAFSISFVLLAQNASTDPSGWWNTSWEYKKQINITDTYGITQTNCAWFVNVSYEANMQADFDDLRFLNSTEDGELNHSIFFKVDSSYAEVFVELPTLTGGSDNIIYMYYGNSTVGNTSNGTNTFIQFDDFEDGDFTGWTETGASVWSVSDTEAINGNKSLKVALAGSFSWVTKDSIVTGNNTIGVWFFDDTGVGGNERSITRYDNYAGGGEVWVGVEEGQVAFNYTYRVIKDGTYYDSQVARTEAWHYFEVGYNTTDNIIRIDHDLINVSAKAAVPNVVQFGDFWNSVGTFYWDDFSFRCFANPEPTVAFGPEVAQGDYFPIENTIISPTNTTYTSTGLDINWTTNGDGNGTYSLDLATNVSVGNLTTAFNAHEVVVSGTHNIYICSTNSSNATETDCDTVYFTTDLPPTVTLNKPDDAAIIPTLPIEFNWTPEDDTGFLLAELYLNTSNITAFTKLTTYNTNEDAGCSGGSLPQLNDSTIEDIMLDYVMIEDNPGDYHIGLVRYNMTNHTSAETVSVIADTDYESDLLTPVVNMSNDMYYMITLDNNNSAGPNNFIVVLRNSTDQTNFSSIERYVSPWEGTDEASGGIYKFSHEILWIFETHDDGAPDNKIMNMSTLNVTSGAYTEVGNIFNGSTKMYEPLVIEEGGVYYMIFGVLNTGVGLAYSLDNGATWTNQGTLIAIAGSGGFASKYYVKFNDDFFIFAPINSNAGAAVYSSESPNGSYGLFQTFYTADVIAPRYVKYNETTLVMGFTNLTQDNLIIEEYSIGILKFWDVNSTNSSAIVNNSVNTISLSVPNGHYKWNIKITDSHGSSAFAGANRTFIFSIASPLLITIDSPENITYTATSIDLDWSTSVEPDFVQYSLNGAANVSLRNERLTVDSDVSLVDNATNSRAALDGNYVWVGDRDGGKDLVVRRWLNGSYAGVTIVVDSCFGGGFCGVHANSTNVFVGNDSGVMLFDKAGAFEGYLTTNTTDLSHITALAGNDSSVWVTDQSDTVKEFNSTGNFVSIYEGISLMILQADMCRGPDYFLSTDSTGSRTIKYNITFGNALVVNETNIAGIGCNTTDIFSGSFNPNFYNMSLNIISENTTITASQNQNNLTVWANISDTSQNETIVLFFVDSINPVVAIVEPQNITYCDVNPQLNFSFTETNPDSCWYSINGTANVTLATCSTNGTSLSSSEGGNNVRLCMNDTLGREGCAQAFYTKDTINPVITITDPENDTLPIGVVNFDFSFDEEIDTAVYSLNGTGNVTNTTLSTSWIGTFGILAAGNHNVVVWANDTCGHENETTRFFTVGTVLVPEPGSVNYNQFLYNFSNPEVNEGASTCWFVLNDNPPTNYTCGTFNTTINANIGENNLTLCWTNITGDFCNETLFNVSIRCSVSDLNDTICGGNDFRYIIMCKQLGKNVYQFDYGNMTFCEFGCIDGTCINRTFCKDNCLYGEKMCNVNNIISCKQKSNGCYDWSSDDRVYCDKGCQDGACLGCQDMCNLGDATCDSPVIRFCDDDNSDGCLEFSNINITECEFGCTEALNLTTGFNNVTCNFHSFDDIYAVRGALTFGGEWFDYVFNTLNLKVWIVLIMMIGFGGIAGIKANKSYEGGWKVGLIIMAGIIFVSSWIGWMPWVVTILFLIFVVGVWFSGRKE